MLFGSAEAHHLLDVRSVIPTPVEQHDFASRRQQRHVTLEIPFCLLSLGGLRERLGTHDSRAGPLADALDNAALAG